MATGNMYRKLVKFGRVVFEMTVDRPTDTRTRRSQYLTPVLEAK